MLSSIPDIAGIWALQSLSMVLTAMALPRLRLTSIFGPLIMVIALGLVNSTIWDAALFLRVPDTLSYQALVLVGANALIFWVLAKLLPGIEISGFIIAVIAPIVFTFVSIFVFTFGRQIEWDLVFRDVFFILGQLKRYVAPLIASSAS